MTNPLIIEAVRVSESGIDWVGFGLDLSSTAVGALVGAALGFMFAVVLSRREQSIQQAGKERDQRLEHAATLRMTVNACGANIETLLSYKREFLGNLKADVDLVAPFAEQRDVEGLAALAPSLRTFFMGFPKLSFLPLPDYQQYSFAAKDVPIFITILHRANTAADDVNNHILSRNSLIEAQALQNNDKIGMTGQAVLYFFAMIRSESRNIISVVDFALYFFDLLGEQAHNYGKYRFSSDGKFPRFEVMEQNRGFMPKRDLFGHWEQFVDFKPKAL